jgi:excisionase family DNA binding protein
VQEVGVSRDEGRDRPTGERDILTSGELQRWLRLGKTKTFELLHDSDRGIPHFRAGRKILIRRRDVEDWLEQNRYHPEERR